MGNFFLGGGKNNSLLIVLLKHYIVFLAFLLHPTSIFSVSYRFFAENVVTALLVLPHRHLPFMVMKKCPNNLCSVFLSELG